MTRPISLAMLVIMCCMAISCKKNEEDQTDQLEGTNWQVVLIDENPASNPTDVTGKLDIIYHPWLDCDKDDIFTFKDGRLSINKGENLCDAGLNLIATYAGQPFLYDKNKGELVLGKDAGSVPLQIYELNGSRLKVGTRIPRNTGFGVLMFLFKKK